MEKRLVPRRENDPSADFTRRQLLSRSLQGYRSIRVTAMVGSQHKDESLSLIDPVEKSVIPDAIPPSLRNSIPKFLDILPDVGIRSQLGIDIRGELALDARLLSTEVLLKVLLEL